MKFSCSNIAWSYDQEPMALDILKKHNITGIEVAPTVIWPNWENATGDNAKLYKKILQDKGFEIPAMQAIMFGKQATSIFNKTDQEKIVSHMITVAELSEKLEAKSIVFGSPKLRNTELSIEDAINEVLPFFRKIATYFNDSGSCFCIEPCGGIYGSNFITSATEASALATAVNHAGFGVHIDSSALHEADESIDAVWENIKTEIKHYHISEPALNDFSNPVIPHEYNLNWLREHDYKGWCSVEMKNSNIPFKDRGPWNIIKKFNN
jgi:D-psicose/D-tagatose/L-ribulose 3-epimerase